MKPDIIFTRETISRIKRIPLRIGIRLWIVSNMLGTLPGSTRLPSLRSEQRLAKVGQLPVRPKTGGRGGPPYGVCGMTISGTEILSEKISVDLIVVDFSFH